jgi:hypothetical protein
MKTAVFVFGRFNPPTIGHEKLLNALTATAQREGGKAFVYTSSTQDARKNPLSKDQIFKYMAKAFPKEKKTFQTKSTAKTALEVAVELNTKYDKLVMVVGSDRVSDFSSLLNTYNGIKAKHGFYEFKEIDTVSAGERDPDAIGASGMSASKMRDAAVQGDFNLFRTGIPSAMNNKDAKNMMNDVRVGLKLDVIREGMRRRRGTQKTQLVTNCDLKIESKELTWQGYETLTLSTCDEAYEMYDEIVNSIVPSTFTKPELAYLKESLILVDKCLTITQVPKEMIEELDVQNYMQYSSKAIKLLENIGKRTGIPFNYSFLNDLQVQVAEDIKPIKTFTQFSGEMYGIR